MNADESIDEDKIKEILEDTDRQNNDITNDIEDDKKSESVDNDDDSEESDVDTTEGNGSDAESDDSNREAERMIDDLGEELENKGSLEDLLMGSVAEARPTRTRQEID